MGFRLNPGFVTNLGKIRHETVLISTGLLLNGVLVGKTAPGIRTGFVTNLAKIRLETLGLTRDRFVTNLAKFKNTDFVTNRFK
jgi:hypothetical protein